jgi:hypothetical protein
MALTLVLLVRLSVRFFAQPESDLISWDQAARAGEAVVMAKEIHGFQLVEFGRRVFSLNWWPPLHYLIMLLFILILGPGFRAIILPSLTAYFFSVSSLLFALKKLPAGQDGDPLLESSLLFFLAVSSPFLLSSATWAMLEIFGIFLTYLGFGLYFKATADNSPKTMRFCGLTGFLLWTLKYYYGLYFSVFILAAELARAGQLRPQAFFSRRRLALLARPVFFPAYLLCGLLIYISLSGGGSFELLGVRISLSNIYNPAMFLYQYLFLVVLVGTGKGWARIKERLRPGQRELLVWGALPAGILLFFPDKIKAIIMNLQAVRQNTPHLFMDNILYYLRTVITDYSLFWPIGVLCIILFVIALANWRRTPPHVRLITAFFLAGFLVTGLSFGLRESRYLATFVPALWLVTAWSFGFVLRTIKQRMRTAVAVFFLVSAAIATGPSSLLIGRALRQPWAPWAHHGSEYRSLIEPVLEETQGAKKVLVLGASDLGFVHLLSWKLEVAQFENPGFTADIDPWPDLRMPASAFLERIHGGDYGSIVLYRVKKGVYQQALRKWPRALRRSGRYYLSRKSTFLAPKPGQVLFFVRLRAKGVGEEVHRRLIGHGSYYTKARF